MLGVGAVFGDGFNTYKCGYGKGLFSGRKPKVTIVEKIQYLSAQ